MPATFQDWTRGRTVPSLGTNTGADDLPFQNWRHFKEAFTPELVARAVARSDIQVTSCLDPFGGSGTTAVACQFLGIHPIIAEVNPFLADLIEAKLSIYDSDALARDLGVVLRTAGNDGLKDDDLFAAMPQTFIEPGVGGRWIFDREAADRIASLLTAIESLPTIRHKRLFRVLLGGILVEVSNVVVNGKGRRYRRNWERRRRDNRQVDELFCDSARRAISEIHRFSDRKKTTFELLRGDSREVLTEIETCDLAVFSPPYPNSFDYTDVYNVELWMLGYLKGSECNRALRISTLCSHVQISRNFLPAPLESSILTTTLEQLVARRSELWDRRIPEMVGGYFADLIAVLDRIFRVLTPGGSTLMVVGDSRYAGIQIATAEIISEIAQGRGWKLCGIEPFRSMRASAQQGGRRELAESLIILSKEA